MEVVFVDIKEKLKELQQQRGWSDYKIAKEAGLSANTVSNIYRRNNLPSIPTLQAICAAFGVTMSQFFAEDELVEVTQEQQRLIREWTRLNDEQKKVVWNLLAVLQN